MRTESEIPIGPVMSTEDAYYAGADIAIDAATSAIFAIDAFGGEDTDATSAAYYAADTACALDGSDEH